MRFSHREFARCTLRCAEHNASHAPVSARELPILNFTKFIFSTRNESRISRIIFLSFCSLPSFTEYHYTRVYTFPCVSHDLQLCLRARTCRYKKRSVLLIKTYVRNYRFSLMRKARRKIVFRSINSRSRCCSLTLTIRKAAIVARQGSHIFDQSLSSL